MDQFSFTDNEKKYLRNKFSYRKVRFKGLLAFVILVTLTQVKKNKTVSGRVPGCTD